MVDVLPHIAGTNEVARDWLIERLGNGPFLTWQRFLFTRDTNGLTWATLQGTAKHVSHYVGSTKKTKAYKPSSLRDHLEHLRASKLIKDVGFDLHDDGTTLHRRRYRIIYGAVKTPKELFTIPDEPFNFLQTMLKKKQGGARVGSGRKAKGNQKALTPGIEAETQAGNQKPPTLNNQKPLTLNNQKPLTLDTQKQLGGSAVFEKNTEKTDAQNNQKPLNVFQKPPTPKESKTAAKNKPNKQPITLSMVSLEADASKETGAAPPPPLNFKTELQAIGGEGEKEVGGGTKAKKPNAVEKLEVKGGSGFVAAPTTPPQNHPNRLPYASKGSTLTHPSGSTTKLPINKPGAFNAFLDSMRNLDGSISSSNRLRDIAPAKPKPVWGEQGLPRFPSGLAYSLPPPPAITLRHVDDAELGVQFMVRWYNAALRARYKKPFVARGTQPQWAMVLDTFYDNGIRPGAWFAYSIDTWRAMFPFKKTPPDLKFMLGTRTETMLWHFRDMDAVYAPSKELYLPEARTYLDRLNVFVSTAQNSDWTEDTIRAQFKKQFPKYESDLKVLRDATQSADMVMKHKLRNGNWLWTTDFTGALSRGIKLKDAQQESTNG